MRSIKFSETHRNFFLEFSKVGRFVVAAVSILGLIVALHGLYVEVGPEDSLGQADFNCVNEDLPSVANRAGMVANAHVIDCSYFIAHGAERTFVYVHKAGEKDSKESLVFRFDNDGNLYRPQMMWSDDLNLKVSVPEVGFVTKQVSSKDRVNISYSIGKEDVQTLPVEYFHLRMHDVGVSFAWLVFLTAICALAVWSILKERKKNKLSRQVDVTEVNSCADTDSA